MDPGFSDSTRAFECAPLANALRSALGVHGIAILRAPLRIGDVYALNRELGEVLRIEDIKIGVTARGAHSARQLALHTDQHFVDTIAWYCVRSAERGGATELVDTAPLLAALDDATAECLHQVTMRCPEVDDRAAPDEVPLLHRDGQRTRIYFAAWNVAPLPDPSLNRAFKRLANDIASAPRIAVRLEPGQCLFIDNCRILHGRGELPIDSPRLLRRFWLRDR